MLSVAVCDDEIAQCAHIAGIIREILKRMEAPCVICQFNSGKALLQADEDFDIIFLDVIMQEPDGLHTARLMREKRKYEGIFVFISSSREYALEAFEVDAVQYLVKPVEEKRVRTILEKIIMQTQHHPREFIMISKEREKKKLFLDNICYFEIRGRKIDAHMTDGIVTYYGQIGALEKALQGKGFFRCHKSYIVHLQYVNSYTKQDIILDNGDTIMIAKRRYEAFGKEFLAYVRAAGV